MLNRKRILEIIVLIIIGLTPLLWLRGDFLITGGDINFSLNPVQEFWQRTQAWNSISNGGQNNSGNFPAIIFYGIQMLFYILTGSLIWTEKLVFVFWFMFSVFSIYYLITYVILKRRNFLVRIVPCLFYQFNFYQLSCWAGVRVAGITALALLPLLFGMFAKIIEQKNSYKKIILFIFLSTLAGSIVTDLPLAIVFSSALIGYIVFCMHGLIDSGKRDSLKKLIWVTATIILGCILINSYIFLPFINTLFDRQNVFINNLHYDYNVLSYPGFKRSFLNILNILRLMDNPHLYATWRNTEYYYQFFVKYLNKRLLLLISFVFPIIAFMGILLRKQNKYARYFSGLLMAGIIIGVGTHLPLKMIYNHPDFFISHSPWLKYGLLMVFSFSILAGLSCDWLYRYLQYIGRRIRWLILTPSMFLIGLIIVHLGFMHSLISGEMVTRTEQRCRIDMRDICQTSKKLNYGFINTAGVLGIIFGSEDALLPLTEAGCLNGNSNHSGFLIQKKIKDLVNSKFRFLNQFYKDKIFCVFVNPSLRNLTINMNYIRNLECPVGFLLQSGNRYIRLFKDGIYTIKAKLAPKFKDVFIKWTEEMNFGAEDISNWGYKENNTVYLRKVINKSFTADILFDGPGSEDEYVQLRKEKVNIDLRKYPLMQLRYKIKDPEVQTIEFVFGLDFNGDGMVDDYLKGFDTKKFTARITDYRLNLFDKVIKWAPNMDMYNVVYIEMYLHKLWGVDCSMKDKKKSYRFTIKNLRFEDCEKKELVEFRKYRINYKPRDIQYRARYGDNFARIKIPINKGANSKIFPYLQIEYRFPYSDKVKTCKLFLHLIDENKKKVVFGDMLQIESGYKEYIMRFNIQRGILSDLEFRIELKDALENKEIIEIRKVKVYRRFFSNKWPKINSELFFIIGNKRISIPRGNAGEALRKEIFINKKLMLEEGLRHIELSLDKNDFLGLQWLSIIPKMDFSNVYTPKISYKKQKETLCHVRVEDTSSPFILVMNNNYDTKWNAYTIKNGQKKRINEHFMLNGFANAWLIKGNKEKSIEILIKYYPQDLFKKGLIISVSTALALIALLVWKWRE